MTNIVDATMAVAATADETPTTTTTTIASRCGDNGGGNGFYGDDNNNDNNNGGDDACSIFVDASRLSAGRSLPLYYAAAAPPFAPRIATLATLLRQWTSNAALRDWVHAQVVLCRPDRVHLCDGTEQERRALVKKMVRAGALQPVPKRKNCYVARSAPEDVARVEARTFICSEASGDAGPLNNWVAPAEMRARLASLFAGAMRGRTMYVVPFCMAPLRSPHAKLAVQVTDSPYVVLNTRIMTHGLGDDALAELERRGAWTPCVHAVGAPLADAAQAERAWPCDAPNRHIVHFTDAAVPHIASYGSGYGGNALLGKKCLALRVASVLGRREGWLAEHMLVLGLTSPAGATAYVCAAFPSACGKTNLAMLVPSLPGWRVECLGDDIAWLRLGDDGRLYAVNPEAGFFGVAPGTSERTNPNAMRALGANCIFTNVAMTTDGDVWWEGMSATPPRRLTDWLGREWRRDEQGAHARYGAERRRTAAHPNSRFTAPCAQCPAISAEWNSPRGVPISAIVFGGRRRDTVPLVFQAYDWAHGVYVGATMASERTAAAEGTLGELRHDPMAMRPFIGYNVGDYFQHWIDMERAATVAAAAHATARGQAPISTLPRIFHVNWFRREPDDDDKKGAGSFLWPGFGENARVLQWIFEQSTDARRVDDPERGGRRTPIGWVPRGADDLNVDGLQMSEGALRALLDVDRAAWLREWQRHGDDLEACGDRVPDAVWNQHRLLHERLTSVDGY